MQVFRPPELKITVSYVNTKGKTFSKVFDNAWKARSYFSSLDRQGKKPQLKVERMD